jgi:diadenosine tetraphosphate (Ap4A) HIT family hydrolase
LKSVIAIFVGAGFGALFRWWLGLTLNSYFPTIPPGTLAANLIGGYVIGVAMIFFSADSSIAPEWRLFLNLLLGSHHAAATGSCTRCLWSGGCSPVRVRHDDLRWHGYGYLDPTVRTSKMPFLPPCPFCSTDGALLANVLAYARSDKYPVTPGHTLILPIRHEADFLALRDDEVKAIWQLVGEARARLDQQLHPEGYNLGVDVGEVAGQTIGHAHLHLTPRYRGDVENPPGGVRGVIPDKQQYAP